MHSSSKRPDAHQYFMEIAMAVRKRASCLGNRVGALAVLQSRIVSTGYNGTPHGMTNCMDGGCHRCANKDGTYQSGAGYDLCICVHAEQNVLLAAARFGIALENSVIYSTMRPCFGCAKEMLQAKISAVYYLHEWIYPDPAKQAEYTRIQEAFPQGVHRLGLPDPDAVWAVSNLRRKAEEAADDTGH
jgi:dCMP deaminase